MGLQTFTDVWALALSACPLAPTLIGPGFRLSDSAYGYKDGPITAIPFIIVCQARRKSPDLDELSDLHA
jgi:hypothetical protein